MLYSLEGMKDLEWDKLLKLQSKNGSFLSSPAATAFAFMQTKDQKCLAYLTNLVAKFKGGVPNAYPVDMYERIWIVDRLQRLGIARYFSSEIKDCLTYIYRYIIKLELKLENYIKGKITKMSPSCVHGRTHPVWEASGSKVEESMNEVVTCVQQSQKGSSCVSGLFRSVH
ncbi:putative ent-copalyl diphosphate synthase [Helianthus annuus]|uniref:Ent-copalyl diphosphate synthase n=1 Tax=Helianthus annuus TaxID=4232 RepID=A0A9K3JMP8_HELAN|nr:putative ent-copalyl diphosphate synthase [Helianthus annuus]